MDGIIKFFRTYSPQGDGNFKLDILAKGMVLGSFSEPIPRKGTETIKNTHMSSTMPKSKFFRTYSPQGDGNLP